MLIYNIYNKDELRGVIMSKTVLIIEDELSLLNILSAYFKKEEFNVVQAHDGLQGLEAFEKNDIDIVCCDVLMPKINGWDVVKSIRQKSNIPIIMMTALGSEDNQLKGYNLEVDDYITKPFSPAILVAKTKALLKRSVAELNNYDDSIEIGNIIINKIGRTVFENNTELHLSKTEFDLLFFFIKNQNIVLDRVTILDEVWGMDVYVEERVVDTYIKVLRKKLGDSGSYIKTIFGVGYKFETTK